MYKNRVTTLILALSMFMSATISASAEDFATIISAIIPMTAEEIFPEILDDKPIEFWSDINNRVTTVVGATDYDSKSGDWSLCAVFKNSKTGQNEYIENTYIPVTLKSGVTYSFGVWCKGSDIAKTKVFISVDGTNNIQRLQAAETEDGWTKYCNTITPSSDITGNICFGFDADFSCITDKEEIKILFDDIYMYEDDSDTNLVCNTSFEETAINLLDGKVILGWSDINNRVTTEVGATDYDSKSGDWSICAVFKNSKTWQNEYIENTYTPVTLKSGVTYSFGVWCKGSDIAKTKVFISVDGTNNIRRLQAAETEDGWTKYYNTITPSSDITGNICFGFDADFSSITDKEEIKILFDDMYIYKDGSHNNLVYNPSFEERLKETDLDEEIVDDLPQILTGKTIEGWSDLNYGGSSRHLRVGPTDFDAKTGEYSLCTVFENKRMGQKDYITNTLQQVTIQAGTTYNYGVWLRGKSISSNCSIFIAVGDVNKKWDIDRKSKTVDG